MKEEIEKEIEEWANMVESSEEAKKKHAIFDKQKEEEFDPESYFDNENQQVNKQKKAENERTKGNEAIRSKDFTEALKYYTTSI